jgi:site-specific DNA-methyltransferase (adenine-specific)
MIDFRNMDCMELMKEYPDKYFDLAIVDPPYGIGISSNPVRQQHKKKEWDSAIPKKEYFEELKRVSKNQIIWGGNYFFDYLGNTQGFLIWDKVQPFDFSLAMCEFAWMSYQKPAKIFVKSVLAENGKIHPTQKPVRLYTWLLTNYAKQGDLILDTHVGSASSLIACHQLGFDVVGCELDEEYYQLASQRLADEMAQMSLFDGGGL